MIRYTKKFVRFAEAWDGEELPAKGVDVLRQFQSISARVGWDSRPVHTILIDLHGDSADLFAQIDPGTRYDIRRGTNSDGFTTAFYQGGPGSAQTNDFYRFFDEFAASARQPAVDRRWLESICRAGQLVLSRVGSDRADQLAWHAYYVTPNRATLLHSASHFRATERPEERQRIGRANRFLHWQDLLHFREAGLANYDLGGWYPGDADPERLRINKFKEQFGGKITRQYTCERALTLRGKGFLHLRNRMVQLD